MAHHDHSKMNHGDMDHSNMDHSNMDHSDHINHGGGSAVPLMESTFSPATAILNALTTVIPAAMGHNGAGHDHQNHGIHNNGLQSEASAVSSNAHGDHDMGGMKMYFHFGYDEKYVLFDFWRISTVGGLIGSMIGIFLMAMLYEGLKVLREYLLQRTLQSDASSRQSVGSSASSSGLRVPLAGEGDSVMESQGVVIKTLFRPNPFSFAHCLQTILHMLQLTISYLLMLIFMTFNIWLCLAVVFGAGAGYFAFGWRKRTIVDINEHCH